MPSSSISQNVVVNSFEDLSCYNVSVKTTAFCLKYWVKLETILNKQKQNTKYFTSGLFNLFKHKFSYSDYDRIYYLF